MPEDRPEPGDQTPGDYEVGYGRPPRHSRFQKGQSGNRKGRPPRSRNLATLLTRALNEQIAVSENGRRRMITKREAIVTQLAFRSAGADLKAMSMLIAMVHQDDASAAAQTPQATSFAEADERVLHNLIERIAAAGGTDDPERP